MPKRPKPRKEWATKLSRLCFIPQRFILAFFGLTATMNCFTQRNSLSISITQMVKERNYTEEHIHPAGVCAKQDTSHIQHLLVDKEEAEFDWDQAEQGHILGAFYIGYIITHLPSGLLTDIYGGKWTLNIGIFSSSVISILTPPLAHIGGGTALYFLRILMGLGQGVVYPACSALAARWIPTHSRSSLGAVIMSGGLFGQAIGQLISAYLAHFHDWRLSFYLFGVSGLIWCAFFTIMCFDDPVVHPYVRDIERDAIEDELGGLHRAHILRFPWLAMVKAEPVWALVTCQIGHSWGLYIMTTDLPKYMNDVLQFHVLDTGVYTSVPFLAMWLTALIAGIISDSKIASGTSVTIVRRVNTLIAQVGPGIFMVAASYSGCEKFVVVGFFTLACALMGPYYSGMMLTPMDLAPNYAGTLMAISHGLAAVCGHLSPTLVGLMTPNTTLNEWRGVFQLSFAILCTTGIIFYVFGAADVQSWNAIEGGDSDDDDDDVDKNL